MQYSNVQKDSKFGRRVLALPKGIGTVKESIDGSSPLEELGGHYRSLEVAVHLKATSLILLLT